MNNLRKPQKWTGYPVGTPVPPPFLGLVHCNWMNKANPPIYGCEVFINGRKVDLGVSYLLTWCGFGMALEDIGIADHPVHCMIRKWRFGRIRTEPLSL